jgi:hypothetical protein
MGIFRRLFGRADKNGGETEEFKLLIEGSMEGLRAQTGEHAAAWQFGKAERWNVLQDTGELVFTFPYQTVRASAQIIGSFDTVENTWMWAWANSSIAEALTQDSIRVRAYGEQRGIRRLTTAQWPATEIDGWNMAALAGRICGSNGVYRAPSGAAFIFITFGEVLLSKRTGDLG